MTWMMEYMQYGYGDFHEKNAKYKKFVDNIVTNFINYQIPTITLKKDTPKEAVCKVFENVNTGGVSLTVFELLTSTYAMNDFELRNNWDECRQKILEIKNGKVMENMKNTDFLQIISLLVTASRQEQAIKTLKQGERAPAVACQRRDILKISLENYEKHVDMAVSGYQEVIRFLYEQKIFKSGDIPYQTQIVPLACIFAKIGKRIEEKPVKDKISQWYWCVVFGELYGSAIETRFSKDVVEVVSWIDGGNGLPTTIVDANFASERLFSMRTKNSAAYKGLYALLLQNGLKDFRGGSEITTEQYFEKNIDIHHVFPKKWCDSHGITKNVRDCIINKTPISAGTNRSVGGNAPSEYLPKIQDETNLNEEQMNEIVATHFIDADALRRDDFQGFFRARQEALLDIIEGAMKKQILRTGTPKFEEIGDESAEEEE